MKKEQTYVVSEDIYNILEGSGIPANHYKNKNIVIPDKDFIHKIRKNFKDDLTSIFPSVEIYSERQMQESMYDLIQNSPYPVVSLDRVYLAPHPKIMAFLDVTRTTKNGEIVLTMRNNNGEFKNIHQGIAVISQQLKKALKTNYPQIALVDDVIFSGDGVTEVANLFKKNGVIVKMALSGICIEETSINLKRQGIQTRTGYKISNYIDQICERDFYFGISHSGMMMKTKDGQSFKCPYFLPFGNPQHRASIPKEYETEFSLGCIDRSISLWQEMERLTKRAIRLNELPEKIAHAQGSTVVKALQQARRQLIRE